jgi:hypothetical protein
MFSSTFELSLPHGRLKDLGISPILALVSVLALMMLCVACDRSADASPKSPLRGLLQELHASGSGELDSFKLVADDGKIWEFKFEPEPGAAVAFSHLQIHVDKRLPVKIAFYVPGRPFVAFRIDDG